MQINLLRPGLAQYQAIEVTFFKTGTRNTCAQIASQAAPRKRSPTGRDQFEPPCANLLHSAACKRAISLYPPAPSGLNFDASPSLTSNQSLPKASRMFGLWVTTMTLDRWRRGDELAQRLRTPVILDGGHDQTTLGKVDRRLDLTEP